MSLSYDVFSKAFLDKVSEYDFINYDIEDFQQVVDSYMKITCARFGKVCKYDLISTGNDAIREFDVDIPVEDLYEIADIISEGMVEQWMKPYVYRADNLANLINTKDFSQYSPAELLLRIGGVYERVQKDFKNMVREYSYANGDLSDLHL